VVVEGEPERWIGLRMAKREDNRNDQALSLTKGQVIRLETEPESLVPAGSPSTHPVAKRTKPSGGPVDTSQALEALMTALTTLSGQLERERIRAYKAEAALVEAQAAQRAATEEAAALRQELQRRRSMGLERLGRLVRAWDGK
jgi:hypothetical protein